MENKNELSKIQATCTVEFKLVQDLAPAERRVGLAKSKELFESWLKEAIEDTFEGEKSIKINSTQIEYL